MVSSMSKQIMGKKALEFQLSSLDSILQGSLVKGIIIAGVTQLFASRTTK